MSDLKMKYRRGYKYQLAELFEIDTPIKPQRTLASSFLILTNTGKLTIRAGYAWDGPSGPTWDTDNSMTPSLVHDAFAQLMREKALDQCWRIPSNKFFGEMLRKRGMRQWRQKLWVRALDKFGAPSTDPKNTKKVLTVD
jgi:hypothetical protein